MKENVEIVFIALSRRTADILAERLRSFFRDERIRISSTTVSEISRGGKPMSPDIALVSVPQIYDLAKPFISPSTKVVFARRRLGFNEMDKLLALPKGTRAIMINEHPYFTEDSIQQVKDAGIAHLEILKYDPKDENPDTSITVALTMGIIAEIPPWVKTVIPLDVRDIEDSTLVEIACEIGFPIQETSLFSGTYAREIIARSMELERANKKIGSINATLNAVFDSLSDLVIGVDECGIVSHVNKAAVEVLGKDRGELEGRSVFDAVPGLDGAVAPGLRVLPNKLARIGAKYFHVELLRPQDYEGDGVEAVLLLRSASDVARLEKEVKTALKSRGHVAKYEFDDIKGESPEIRRAIAQARRLAASELTILVMGENGTGKELFAHSIHKASGRCNGPFIASNCASLPSSLIESELFGYEEGAFTGALKGGKPGIIEQAHGGTVFLDELGDVSIEAQSRLLRVIQEKEIMRVGATRIVPIDVRIVAATNKDLDAMVASGEFRRDLYYRLCMAPLYVPPLRDRKEDIPLLARDCMRRIGMSPSAFDAELARAFEAYDWPGNVRELLGLIEYAATMGEDERDMRAIMISRVRGPAKAEPSLPLGINPRDEALCRDILEIFKEAADQKLSLGRGLLIELLRKRDVSLSEQSLRSRIEKLRSAGLLVSGKGRQATSITASGRELLTKLKTDGK